MTDPTADAAKRLPFQFKKRSPGFLSEENINHASEPFDYIRELHEVCWRFVRAVCPNANGTIDDWIGPALLIAERNTRPQPAPPSNEWGHITNEWADAATNGLQWLRNVREGVSRPEDGIAEMENNITRIRALQPPAPPAGEPDFDSLLAAFVEDKKYQWWTNKYTIEFGNLMYRLGLAARPKVEDAEVAELVTKLRRALGWSKSRDGLCKEAADLLERLAMKVTSFEARDAGWALDVQEAESKMAEREAELAKVDAVITVARSFVRAVEENHLTDAGSLALKFERFAAAQHLLCDAVKQYDAARQQQAAADKDGETR